MAKPANPLSIDELIEQLRSRDEAELEKAHEAIMSLGEDVTEPLCTALKDG